MDQLSAEKRLTITYIFCIAVGAITSITTGIAWGHWYRTLDQCVGDRNCSCIIYGEHTATVFLGGPQAPCIWVTFGPLFYIFFCIGLTCFHGYRVLFTTKSPITRTMRSVLTKTESGETIQIQAVTQEITSPLPKAFWICVTVLSVFFTVYSIVHFAVYVDGYYKTCNQYRKTLEKHLSLHGSALPVLYHRLSCQGVFDFMDYMQLDTGNAYRNGIINTGLSLILGVASAGMSWILFLHSSILNIMLAKAN
ncbi:uncharacterized protein LOC108914490 [Anoplophora glabripennis]|uniref:uncharacterized protein LOC108914490 n=1 Tax=Anoplophora glabripennis TaxID=217634 RepID=UPI000873515B|nr:uncharacterized protein LOC108914490 [Anoplophora glabripennis]XP_018575824.1 uncharacterized protein LOC108914490 [Anoplophora glabripennis]